jgi:hypothetical protein
MTAAASIPPVMPAPPVIPDEPFHTGERPPLIASRTDVRKRRIPLWLVIPLGLLLVLCLIVAGIASCFFLSSDTAALRNCVMSSVPGEWNRKVALNLGWFPVAVLRTASGLVNLPADARAGLSAFRRGDVGVYRLNQAEGPVDRGAILASADAVMERRGWMRAIGVVEHRNLVGVYVPREGVTEARMKCCLVVLNGRELVVASAESNPGPLMELMQRHVNLDDARFQLEGL